MTITRLACLGAASLLLTVTGFATEDGSAAKTPAAAPMVVYDTALAPGWQNWSWAKTELSVQLGGSARRPIRVEAAGWQALYLQHAAVSTAGLRQLEMLIQGSAPDGVVRVFMLTDGKPNGEGHTVHIGNAGWTQVVMPLAELASDDRMIDGIWVQNASGNQLPKFYVTEIRLQ
jgi:hypothetical protein